MVEMSEMSSETDAEYETIVVESDDDGVAMVTLNRPDRLNSFNRAMCRDFAVLWAKVRADASVRAVVLRAAGEPRVLDRTRCHGTSRG